jgi:hypothetical protein
MTIRFVRQWNGYDDQQIATLSYSEEIRLVGLGIAIYYLDDQDGLSNKIVFYGDSLTAANLTGTSSTYLNGFGVTSNILANGIMDVVGYAGYSGFNIKQLADQVNTVFDGIDTDYVFVLAGTNTSGVVPDTVDNYKAQLTRIYDALEAKGYKLILGTIPPREPDALLIDQKNTALFNQVNAWIKSQTLNGRYVVDLFEVMVDATTNLLRANVTDDLLHQNKRGAYFEGKAIANLLKTLPIFTKPPTTSSFMDPYILNPNPGLIGNNATGVNGTSIVAPVTGTGPTLWTFNATNATCAVAQAASSNLDKSENEVTFTVSYTADGGVVKLLQDIQIVAWSATAAKFLGNLVYPTVDNGLCYKAIVAGTTAGTQPTWPTTIGEVIADGTVTWLCMPKVIAEMELQLFARLEVVSMSGQWAPELTIYTHDNAFGGTHHPATLNLGVERQSANASIQSMPGVSGIGTGFKWPEAPVGDITVISPIIRVKQGTPGQDINRFGPGLWVYGSNGTTITFKVKSMELRIL